MVTVPVAKPISQMHLAPGSVVSISGLSWEEFECLLEELGTRRAARIAYSNGTLEIMVPLPEHERPTELISDLVKQLLSATGQDYEPFGSTTFKREGIAGVEPDACFYIQHAPQMRGRRRLQPGDPPPDLAIEYVHYVTDITSVMTLAAYEAIAVPELWVYANGNLTFYILHDGHYVESEYSPTFPELPVKQMILEAVAQVWTVGTPAALQAFQMALRAWLQKSDRSEV
ncbi:Uma2 family endonuclease [Thermoleptolyngbya sichuanensis A183]|uniref:Uma2 family endonuclease n=1 Tax=Thermoleptolyngbya sichuanensis A183 TaxID=2737172 RepID=A0A6M8BEY3_9CYAN|nr:MULTISPECIES: Uma2 family endonuclease [Thermoleptolyngbya]QKD81713.1 Uma2 family endonuclease [Thermoleptolyngbya sichuanensis A183]